MHIERKTVGVIKIILAILLVTGNSFANDDVLRDKNEDLLVFIVNQDNVPVYNKIGDKTPLPGINLSMADSYVASAMDFGKRKLLLSEIQRTESGKQINQIGWVNFKYILGRWSHSTQQFLPRKKSMAIYEAPESIGINRTINKQPNMLPFRILFKQEGERVKTTKAPGIDSVHGQIQYGFVWYYVYDVQTVDDKLYYLIGNKRSLFKIVPDLSIDKPTKDEITNNLLGWVKSEHFIIWPTNLAFEYVTTLKAVKERFDEKRPGVIFTDITDIIENTDTHPYHEICEDPNQSSDKISACEPLEEWWVSIFNDAQKLAAYNSLDEDEQIKTCLCGDETKYHCLDPCGLDRNIQRLHLMEETENNWFKVATLGDIGIGSGTWSSTKSYEIFINAFEKSKALDLVFIVDATGSMGVHIEQIKNFISRINDTLKKLQDQHSVPIAIPGESSRTITAKMDINISMLLFQEVGGDDVPENEDCYQISAYQTCIHIHAKSLRNNASQIDTALEKLLESEEQIVQIEEHLFLVSTYKYLQGGAEALYEGINRALSEQKFWRHYTSEKLLVILTDEPGDKGNITKPMILDQRKALRKQLATESGISITEQDNKIDTLIEFIGIWAIYAKHPEGKGECFDNPCPEYHEDHGHSESFKQRLGQITYSSGPLDRVKAVNYHSQTDNTSDTENTLITILSKRVVEANKAILEKTKSFSEPALMSLQKRLKENRLLDQSSAGIIKDQQVLAALGGEKHLASVISFLGNSHFVSGVLKKQYDGLDNPTYRKVVLFQRAELINYEETLRTFTSKFDKSLKVGLNRTYKNVSRLIVQAILLGIAKITDDEETGELFTDQEALKKAVSALISRIHSQDSLRLADLLGYQTVLPDQKGMNESLLSMPLKEIITVPRNVAKRKNHIKKIKRAIRQVQTKIFCLDKVITGNKAPNNPNRCRAYPSSEKDWRYIHPVSGDSYYYVPFQFIP